MCLYCAILGCPNVQAKSMCETLPTQSYFKVKSFI